MTVVIASTDTTFVERTVSWIFVNIAQSSTTRKL